MRKLILITAFLLCIQLSAGISVNKNAKSELQTVHKRGGEYPKKVSKLLDRNVRIDFNIIPAEGSNKEIYIITASEKFEIEITQTDENKYHNIEIDGQVRLLDDRKIFIYYQIETHLNVNDSKADKEFDLVSSVILKPGEEIEVTDATGRVFKIKASYLNED